MDKRRQPPPPPPCSSHPKSSRRSARDCTNGVWGGRLARDGTSNDDTANVRAHTKATTSPKHSFLESVTAAAALGVRTGQTEPLSNRAKPERTCTHASTTLCALSYAPPVSSGRNPLPGHPMGAHGPELPVNSANSHPLPTMVRWSVCDGFLHPLTGSDHSFLPRLCERHDGA